MTDTTAPLVRPLAGKTVVMVHPAWHSCGSHTAFVSQAAAYRALGARLISLAVDDHPAFSPAKQSGGYFGATADLGSADRHWLAMPAREVVSPTFLLALAGLARGDRATLRLDIAGRATIPRAVSSLPRIDLIHCNHFFCLPVAEKVRAARSTPIVVETHDIQAEQYASQNEGHFFLPPRATYDSMLAIELAQMNRADSLIHLNWKEAETFAKLLPHKTHSLVHPAVASMPPAAGRDTLLIVAANNEPNVASILWFLREVMPLAPNAPVKIVGSIDQEIRRRDASLHQRYASLFTGRLADLDAVYRDAAAILLPTVAGHGISIKTLEALSSGAPLIATPLAFRGIEVDVAGLGNVTLTEEAETFAQAMRAVDHGSVNALSKEASDTRRLYESHFSIEAYHAALVRVVLPLIERTMPTRREPVTGAQKTVPNIA